METQRQRSGLLKLLSESYLYVPKYLYRNNTLWVLKPSSEVHVIVVFQDSISVSSLHLLLEIITCQVRYDCIPVLLCLYFYGMRRL